jgi:hypothetical protein
MTAKMNFALYLALLITFVACKKESEHVYPPLTENQRILVEELNALAIPFSNNPLALPDNGLAFLNTLKGARIVGLGEATHGSKEFLKPSTRCSSTWQRMQITGFLALNRILQSRCT